MFFSCFCCFLGLVLLVFVMVLCCVLLLLIVAVVRFSEHVLLYFWWAVYSTHHCSNLWYHSHGCQPHLPTTSLHPAALLWYALYISIISFMRLMPWPCTYLVCTQCFVIVVRSRGMVWLMTRMAQTLFLGVWLPVRSAARTSCYSRFAGYRGILVLASRNGKYWADTEDEFFSLTGQV